MEEDFERKLIVAASAARAAGFEGTYEALLDLAKILKDTELDQTVARKNVTNSTQIH